MKSSKYSNAYFMVIDYKINEEMVELKLLRSNKKEGYSLFVHNVKKSLFDRYIDLTNNTRKSGKVFLLKTKMRKVWAKDSGSKRYDIEIIPVLPDRVCKVVSPFLSDNYDKTILDRVTKDDDLE